MIAQLHVYHPWHWRNVSFSESPHKTLIYKSLAEISPLAKLPSQAVDFQTQCLQSAAQHGTLLSEEIRGRVGDRGSTRAAGTISELCSGAWVTQPLPFLRVQPQGVKHALLIMSTTFIKARPTLPWHRVLLALNWRIGDEVRVHSECPSQPGVNIRMMLGICSVDTSHLSDSESDYWLHG